MRCIEFDARWNEVLDLRECPENDMRLRAHLESCAACRHRQASFELISGLLAELPPPQDWSSELSRAESSGAELSRAIGPDDLTRRVLAELAGPRHVARRAPCGLRFRDLAVRAAAIGVAAATLLAISFPGGWSADARRRPVPFARHIGPEVAESMVARRVAGARIAVAGKASSGFRRSIFDANSVAHGIGALAHSAGAVVHGTSRDLASVVRRIPDVAVELAGNGRADLTAASEPLFNVSQSLRPVATSMTETWQILKHAMPLGEPRRG